MAQPELVHFAERHFYDPDNSRTFALEPINSPAIRDIISIGTRSRIVPGQKKCGTRTKSSTLRTQAITAEVGRGRHIDGDPTRQTFNASGQFAPRRGYKSDVNEGIGRVVEPDVQIVLTERLASRDAGFTPRASSTAPGLKCRLYRRGRYAPPVHMIKLTATQEI
jgi:hypothetical protein